MPKSESIRYRITGAAARKRIKPLLPADWIDHSEDNDGDWEFLWENAPRFETRLHRDKVKCYSHLPTSILDSKWVLARLMPANIESHCFQGGDYDRFKETVQLNSNELHDIAHWNEQIRFFPDLHESHYLMNPSKSDSRRPNLWVVKDADANGAGGVWVVDGKAKSPPLLHNHRYVAQRYVWPMVLYKRRKCHVRVYAVLLADGRAFVHLKCFLHVANEPFSVSDSSEESVHITNCCANSDDVHNFAGEICTDLQGDDGMDLQAYRAAIHDQVAKFGQATLPFMKGGTANGGFEYMGLDFILSGESSAFLLEVNAPPSQDTATGLPHAEETHDVVIQDLIKMWILPRTQPGVYAEQRGGWCCVFEPSHTVASEGLVPSRAILTNMVRWFIHERKLQHEAVVASRHNQIVRRIRSFFPYFQREAPIFFENAGGTQVPSMVIQAVTESLQRRDRSTIGAGRVVAARSTLRTIVGAQDYDVYLGPNATELFDRLATAFFVDGVVKDGDVILIDEKSHLANVMPWVHLATKVGASVRWCNLSSELGECLCEKTRVVALPHASNVLGKLANLDAVCENIKAATNSYAIVVVDGVAAVPHTYADIDSCSLDWYVISLHKMFGPHLGALFGKMKTSVNIEKGTQNYEACEGVVGLGKYFSALASVAQSTQLSADDLLEKEKIGTSLSKREAVAAYNLIGFVEHQLTEVLLKSLKASSNVRVLESSRLGRRLPIASFTHRNIDTNEVVRSCRQDLITCRRGTFLSTESLLRTYQCNKDGVVRFSLTHYNSIDEVHYAVTQLEKCSIGS